MRIVRWIKQRLAFIRTPFAHPLPAVYPAIGSILLALFGCLFVIFAICGPHDFGALIIEGLFLVAILGWVSIALSNTAAQIVLNAIKPGAILFSILFFVTYQTVQAFWITLTVLVALVLIEHWQRHDADPLYSKVAQTLTVISAMVQLLRHFTSYFLPSLQHTLTAQFEYVNRFFDLKQTLFDVILAIILLGTGVNTIQRFHRFEWKPLFKPRSNWLLLTIFLLIEYLPNFSRQLAIAFVTFFREAIIYTYETFFSAPLWNTIIYIALTTGLGFALVADVIYVQTDLYAILRNTDPFLAPTQQILSGYLHLVLAFVLSAICVLLLVLVSLPRSASLAQCRSALQRCTSASVGLVICMWFAGFFAWGVNALFYIHPNFFVTPGYFTTGAIIFALWALFTARLHPAIVPIAPERDANVVSFPDVPSRSPSCPVASPASH
jgi:hypothetical protein